MVRRKLVASRSEAESWIRMGKVSVNGQQAVRSGQFVDASSDVILATSERYVSRAGLKLASVASQFAVVFTDTTVLDVGSSTGGFTDYALQHGARKVYAIDVGTEQLHPSLRGDKRIELHEKTDIRDFTPDDPIDIVVIDVSFISIRDILPHVAKVSSPTTTILAMVKPQFEAGKHQINKGVIKNDTLRREILRDFEIWSKQYFVIKDKADSTVHGTKGNQERFYKLQRSTTG